MSNKFPFQVEPSTLIPLYGKDGTILGTLHHNICALSGELRYAVLAFDGGSGKVIQIPLPWAIITHDQHTGTYNADVDRLQLLEAPHLENAKFNEFDAGFAGQIDASYGLEFPGIESLNDFA